jgi:hypothetical protein
MRLTLIGRRKNTSRGRSDERIEDLRNTSIFEKRKPGLCVKNLYFAGRKVAPCLGDSLSCLCRYRVVHNYITTPLRLPFNADRIWSRCSSQERERVSRHDSTGSTDAPFTESGIQYPKECDGLSNRVADVGFFSFQLHCRSL